MNKKSITQKLVKKVNLTSVSDKDVIIDRKLEDDAVCRFQQTGDTAILEDVYIKRIPTIWKWTNDHYNPSLTNFSKEDLFSELSSVFVKAACDYEKKRGAFNTCLFTFLLNRIKNIKSSRHAKKRCSKEYDGPLSGMILSLDYSYSDKDGTEVTLKDILDDTRHGPEQIPKNMHFEETLQILSKENQDIKGFLRQLSEGDSLSTLIKQYKTKDGFIRLNCSMSKQKRLPAKTVSNLIRERVRPKYGFRLLNYKVRANKLLYRIEMKKTDETDMIVKTLRKLRKNKAKYLTEIVGR